MKKYIFYCKEYETEFVEVFDNKEKAYKEFNTCRDNILKEYPTTALNEDVIATYTHNYVKVFNFKTSYYVKIKLIETDNDLIRVINEYGTKYHYIKDDLGEYKYIRFHNNVKPDKYYYEENIGGETFYTQLFKGAK